MVIKHMLNGEIVEERYPDVSLRKFNYSFDLDDDDNYRMNTRHSESGNISIDDLLIGEEYDIESLRLNHSILGLHMIFEAKSYIIGKLAYYGYCKDYPDYKRVLESTEHSYEVTASTYDYRDMVDMEELEASSRNKQKWIAREKEKLTGNEKSIRYNSLEELEIGKVFTDASIQNIKEGYLVTAGDKDAYDPIDIVTIERILLYKSNTEDEVIKSIKSKVLSHEIQGLSVISLDQYNHEVNLNIENLVIG